MKVACVIVWLGHPAKPAVLSAVLPAPKAEFLFDQLDHLIHWLMGLTSYHLNVMLSLGLSGMWVRFSLLTMGVTEVFSAFNPGIAKFRRFGIPTKATRFKSINFHLTDQRPAPKLSIHVPKS